VSGELLTAPEVAHVLGVPVSWVYEQSRRGRIPTVTLGRYRRFRRSAIDAWVDRLEAGTPSIRDDGRVSVPHG
jgi:excisionase family DNA binding protein